MAKIKRTIRKLPPVAQAPVEEQLWPIYVALLLFGGLLAGVALAYLRFDDRVWYRNALLWLLLVPVFVGSAMAALYLVNTRVVRRAVQLAMVLSLLLHFAFFWQLYYWKITGKFDDAPQKGIARRPERQIRVSIERPVPRPTRRDFERPLETPQPDTTPEPVEKQETKPDEPKPPEPVPPKPEEQPQPTTAVAQKAAAAETTPRFSDTPSKLSKQTRQKTISPSTAADAPQVAAKAETAESKPEVAVAKAATDAKSEAKPAAAEATSVTPTTDAQVAKKEVEQPKPEETATPALKKAESKVAPSAIAKVETPSATQQTDASEVTPRTVSPDKRPTATIEVAHATTEPAVETPSEVKTEVQRRATVTETKPTLATAEQSVPNPRPRETTRPSVSTIASTAATADTPQQTAQTEVTPNPSATSVAKATSATSPSSAATAASPEATSSTTPSTASVARRSTNATATSPAETASITSPKKATTQAGIASATAEAQPVAAATQSSTDGELSPTSVAVRKQATASAETAPATGSPTSAAVAGTTAAASANLAARNNSAESASTPTDNPQVAAAGKSATQTALNVNSSADTNTANVGASVAADASTVGPSSAQLARQPSNSPGATTSRQPLATESLSAETSTAASGVSKASVASVPTLNPSLAPSSSPARAATTAQAVASPTNAEAPSFATSDTGQGEPNTQPSQFAVTKSLSGVAGVGQSPNLDRSLPAADSPALVASGSARRAEATQNTPDGPALSPSSTAIAGRSRASADAPTSTLRAADLPNASQAGTDRVADVNASAGAALAKQSSNAEQGTVTAQPGQVEVDLGPTQTIADSGASQRASGGGRPEINSDSQAKQPARTRVGGTPAASLATNTKADAPEAPAGTGGGAPKSLDADTKAATIARTQVGGEAAVTGGPATASERGPATEVSAAALVGEAPLAKNDKTPGGAPQAAGNPTATTGETAPRVAKSTGGAPQLAVGGPTVAEVPSIPRGDGGSPPSGEAAPASATVAKSGGTSGEAVSAPAASEVATASSGGVIASTNVGRAEAVEATPGAPSAGGGNNATPRRSTGPALASSSKADVPTISGAPASGGSEQGTPIASSGVSVAKSGGASGTGTAAPAAADPSATGGTAVGEAATARASAGPSGDAPVIVASSAGSPGRKASATALPGGTSTAAETIATNPGTLAIGDTGDIPLTGLERGEMQRQATSGALPVNVAAEEGPGGLGSQVATDAGINSRRASSDSMEVTTRESRFIRQKTGGDLDVNTSAIVSTEGFRKRGPETRGGGPSGPQTEKSVELGLVYLERCQRPDGSWSLQGHDPPTDQSLASDTAATALAVLAFQGAGYSHREHKYKDVVGGGIQFLVQNQKQNGDLFLNEDDESNKSAWLYSHALATLALCEAYGMTGDPALREPAQKAVDFIVASQHPQYGGWRYAPREGTDLSVSGWMMMALKSAEMANLDVPAGTYDNIRKLLDVADNGDTQQHLYRYNPWAKDIAKERHGRSATKTMTSVGLLMRLYLSWEKNDKRMQLGADYLLANPPRIGTVAPRTVQESPRDTYYWYYSTQVMWHLGGEYWQRWQAEMHPLLLKTQIQEGKYAGSWDPNGAIPDRWGPWAGRLYVTTMNLLSLEVQYRYLPIYESEKK